MHRGVHSSGRAHENLRRRREAPEIAARAAASWCGLTAQPARARSAKAGLEARSRGNVIVSRKASVGTEIFASKCEPVGYLYAETLGFLFVLD